MRTILLQTLRSGLLTVARGGMLFAALPALAVHLGWLHWGLDLFANSALVVLVAVVPTVALFAGLGHRRWAIFGAVVALGLAWPGAGYWVPAGSTGPAAEGELRVLVSNVLTQNPDPERLLALIQRTDPDVLALMEVNERWMLALEGQDLPLVASRPRPDNFGVGLWARAGAGEVAAEVVEFGDHALPGITARIPVGGRQLTLWLVHTLPPVSADYAAARDAQLVEVAARVRGVDPVVVVGDLNATPTSVAYRRLLRDSGLVHARPRSGAWGPLGTWPSGLPGPLRIAIDHALVSPSVVVRGYEVGPDIGSDHRPLLLTLGLAR